MSKRSIDGTIDGGMPTSPLQRRQLAKKIKQMKIMGNFGVVGHNVSSKGLPGVGADGDSFAVDAKIFQHFKQDLTEKDFLNA